MKRKFFYATTLICCMSFFSSARQMAVGASVDLKKKEVPACVKKEKSKKIADSSQRPFNFFLINI